VPSSRQARTRQRSIKKVVGERHWLPTPVRSPRFRAGKAAAFNQLVSLCKRPIRGKANLQQVNDILRRRLTAGAARRSPPHLTKNERGTCTAAYYVLSYKRN
jgi:hypothetical protein